MVPSALNNQEAYAETLRLFGTDTIPAGMVNTNVLFMPHLIEVYGEHAEKVFEVVCKSYPNCEVQIEA